jgi:hypothetical protein
MRTTTQPATIKRKTIAFVKALGPRPWQTYPSIKFSGTVAQIERAFHVTVMRGPGSVHRCCTVFDSLRMPARFAPKGESYVEAFSFDEDAIPGLKTHCGGAYQ